MAAESDVDVFAIPDFWKPSMWLEQSPFQERTGTHFFGLEIKGENIRDIVSVLSLRSLST
jgi:hypothetical protein